MNFLNTRIFVVSSESNRRSFGKNIFAVEIFVKKLNFGGGEINQNLEKVYTLIFFGPSLMNSKKKSMAGCYGMSGRVVPYFSKVLLSQFQKT